LFTTGSLWANLHHFKSASVILGALACLGIVNFMSLLVPGVRTEVRLYRNSKKPSLNRIVITYHIFQQIELLPLQIHSAYLNTSVWRACTTSEAITLNMSNGGIIRLEAPSSSLGTRRLLSEINSVINEGKTLVAKY